jgi:WD40 repeat protein
MYQPNDPRYDQGLLESYSIAKDIDSTANPIHIAKGAEKLGHGYKKRGGYKEPILSDEKDASMNSAVICVTSYHPALDRKKEAPEKPFVVTGSIDGSIRVFDMLDLSLRYSIPGVATKSDETASGKNMNNGGSSTHGGHSDAVTDIKVYQPLGEALVVLVSASKDKTIQVTQMHSGKTLGVMRGHLDAVWSLDLFIQHNMEPLVISGSLDGSVCIWSMLNQQLLQTIDCESGAVLKAGIFCSEKTRGEIATGTVKMDELDQGVLILVATEDRTLSLWDLQTGTRAVEFPVHPMRITDCVSHVPNSWSLASEFDINSDARAARANVGKASYLKEMRTREFISDSETDLLIFQREATVMSACHDGIIRIYLARSALLLRKLEAPWASLGTTGIVPAFSMSLFIPTEYTNYYRVAPIKKEETDDEDNNLIEEVLGEVAGAIGNVADFIQSERLNVFGEGKHDIERGLTPLSPPSRLYAAFKNGKVVCWDVGSGSHLRSYDVSSGDSESSISCLVTDAFTDDEIARTSKDDAAAAAAAAGDTGGDGAAVDMGNAMNRCPFFFAGGISGRLWKRTDCTAETMWALGEQAYSEDKMYKVSRDVASTVPREFSSWPRMYLLAKAYGGIHCFFAGINYSLFYVAIKDRNCDFISTFLPYADSGMMLSSREFILMDRRETHLANMTEWLKEYRVQSAWDKGYIPYAGLILSRILTNPYFLGKLILRTFKNTIEFDGPLNDNDTHRSLLKAALEVNDIIIVRQILNKWTKLLNTPPADVLDQTCGAHVLFDMDDLIEVSKNFPFLFEKFVCDLEALPTHQLIQDNCSITIPANKATDFRGSGNHLLDDMSIWVKSVDTKKKRKKTILEKKLFVASSSVASSTRRRLWWTSQRKPAVQEKLACFYIPLNNACSEKFINALVASSYKNNSVDVFRSKVGETIIKYVWSAGGRDAHMSAVRTFLMETVLLLLCIMHVLPPMDANPHWRPQLLGLLFLGFFSAWTFLWLVQFIFFIARAKEIETVNNYFGNVWSVHALLVKTLALSICWSIYILCGPADTDFVNNSHLRRYVAILVILHFFRVLYFARAFEATGVLVAMVFQILGKMKTYLGLIIVFTAATSLILVILATAPGHDDASIDDDNAFHIFPTAFTEIMTWILSGYDPSDLYKIKGTGRRPMAIGISMLYQALIGTVFLNLLIAFMTDIFDNVNQSGKAEWRRMQLRTVNETLNARLQGYQDTKERRQLSPKTIHFAERVVSSASPSTAGGSVAAEKGKGRINEMNAQARLFSTISETLLNQHHEHLLRQNEILLEMKQQRSSKGGGLASSRPSSSK